LAFETQLLWEEIAALQALLGQFPMQIIRENISVNRESFGDYQGI
jgi:hypothetical protein